MTFQPGNPGGGKRKEKLFYEALMLAVKDEDDKRSLRKLAERLLDLAIGGDIQALKEVANRIDGQPVQQQEIDITQRFVAEVPPVIEDSDEWLKAAGRQLQ